MIVREEENAKSMMMTPTFASNTQNILLPPLPQTYGQTVQTTPKYL